MKELVFAAAALCVPPLAFLLSANRRWLRWAMAATVLAACFHDSLSITFCARPDYRGTARGFEVGLVHLLSFAVLGALALSGRLRGRRAWVPDAGAALFLLYAALCLPSLAAAESVLYAGFELWKTALLYVFYLAVRNWLHATGDVRAALRGLALFAAANLLAVVRDHFAGSYQPHGLFPHQNSMAVAMHLLGCLFLAGWLLGGARPRFGRLCLAGLLCAAAATVRSFSRMALALMPAGYGLAWLLCLRAARPRRRVLARTAPLAAAALVGLAAMAPRIVERFETAPEESGTTRVELARCAREMILDEPLRGVGLNNWGIKINPPWEYAERAGRDRGGAAGRPDAVVETVYLLTAAECGIPALLALLAWLGWHWALCFRLARRLRGTPWAFVPAGLAGGLLAVYAQSCFEWVLRQSLVQFCLVACFALLSHGRDVADAIRRDSLSGPLLRSTDKTTKTRFP